MVTKLYAVLQYTSVEPLFQKCLQLVLKSIIATMRHSNLGL